MISIQCICHWDDKLDDVEPILAWLGTVGEGLTGEASTPSSIDVVCVVVLAAVLRGLRGWA